MRCHARTLVLELMRDVFGLSISAGAVVGCQKIASRPRRPLRLIRRPAMNRIHSLQGQLPVAPIPLALARKGFRPFFLLAMTFACAVVPAWLLVVFGGLHPGTYLDAVSWHAHEMIFGYAVAVIAGFLLTAVGNWTGRETLVGGKLLGLAGVWVLGRLAMATPTSFPRGVVAVVDLAFLTLLGLALAWPLLATRNRRNVAMLGILVTLFATNVIVHLEALGHVLTGSGRRALLVAIDVIALLCAVMAGRVLPMFTRNATRAPNVASSPALEAMSGLAMIAVVLSDRHDGARGARPHRPPSRRHATDDRSVRPRDVRRACPRGSTPVMARRLRHDARHCRGGLDGSVRDRHRDVPADPRHPARRREAGLTRAPRAQLRRRRGNLPAWRGVARDSVPENMTRPATVRAAGSPKKMARRSRRASSPTYTNERTMRRTCEQRARSRAIVVCHRNFGGEGGFLARKTTPSKLAAK